MHPGRAHLGERTGYAERGYRAVVQHGARKAARSSTTSTFTSPRAGGDRVRGLRQQYAGGVRALDGVGPRRRARAVRGAHRAERSGQVDPLALPERPRDAERRRVRIGDAAVTRRLARGRSGASGRASASCSSSSTCCAGSPCWRTRSSDGSRAPALALARGWFAAAEVARARAALARVGLGGLADRRVDTLSGGQQQRVAIRARWSRTGASSWPTSRCRASIPRWPDRDGASAARSTRRTASRW